VPFAFEKLLVYQKSVTLTDAVCTATKEFPRGYYFLADQLNRAALSIATNLAEGNGRFTAADRRNFFGIARGSVQECVPLLDIAMRRQLLTPDAHARLITELEEISRMVSGLITGVDRRSPDGSRRYILATLSH
jgi:four helix bundle protein